MSTANHRHERVGEEIAHEINAMLAGELKDPRLEGSVVVSEVRVQPDMRHARVFVSVRGTAREQQDAIRASSTLPALFAANWWSACSSAARPNCTLRWIIRRSTRNGSISSSSKCTRTSPPRHDSLPDFLS
ncbi:MAG TPA: ribosome-binding factor A [Candidatus Acidoferrum sp.]|nr:ribosome-binding factor A [Candidatus Acidoferrum sp.]